jgi:ABC-type molybdenum transport system ATPase subunit/photorepair protein PhrA
LEPVTEGAKTAIGPTRGVVVSCVDSPGKPSTPRFFIQSCRISGISARCVGVPAVAIVDENIEITGLRRGSVIEPFGSLSLGTREQLAVLARLAFADLLHEKGQPAAVILDDAIVYADEERFKNMLLILAKAAKNLQVIVLTCHEHEYTGSGAHIIRLADCRRPNSPLANES